MTQKGGGTDQIVKFSRAYFANFLKAETIWKIKKARTILCSPSQKPRTNDTSIPGNKSLSLLAGLNKLGQMEP